MATPAVWGKSLHPHKPGGFPSALPNHPPHGLRLWACLASSALPSVLPHHIVNPVGRWKSFCSLLWRTLGSVALGQPQSHSGPAPDAKCLPLSKRMQPGMQKQSVMVSPIDRAFCAESGKRSIKQLRTSRALNAPPSHI